MKKYIGIAMIVAMFVTFFVSENTARDIYCPKQRSLSITMTMGLNQQLMMNMGIR